MSDSLQSHGLYIAHQAPLSMEFSRQEYWSGLPFSSPEDLPDLGIEPMSLASLAVAAVAGGFFFFYHWESNYTPIKFKKKHTLRYHLTPSNTQAMSLGLKTFVTLFYTLSMYVF